jgi:hypothetical protein
LTIFSSSYLFYSSGSVDNCQISLKFLYEFLFADEWRLRVKFLSSNAQFFSRNLFEGENGLEGSEGHFKPNKNGKVFVFVETVKPLQGKNSLKLFFLYSKYVFNFAIVYDANC